MADITPQSIYNLTNEQLTTWLENHGWSHYWAQQVWHKIYRERAIDIAQMNGINESCLALLDAHFTTRSMEEITRQQSADGTVKFLFKLADGNIIETVLMRHRYGLSVCVTTQVGCNIGCSFCASGLLSKSRNLTCGEIVEQVMHVQTYLDQRQQAERVSHIVVMGIGEPFDNYDHVANFIRIMKDQKGLAIGPRSITVSTSGLAPKIKMFADSDLQVNLAISLHAPNNELRSQIMKINRTYPIEQLFDAIDYYLAATNQRVTLEYIMLKELNDQRHHAEQLAQLIGDRQKQVNVNLIPYNPVDEHSQYARSPQEAVLAFYDTLKKRGISCTIRAEHGADIDAACGQLRSKQIRLAQ